MLNFYLYSLSFCLVMVLAFCIFLKACMRRADSYSRYIAIFLDCIMQPMDIPIFVYPFIPVVNILFGIGLALCIVFKKTFVEFLAYADSEDF